MTRRERMEARADRREQWAASASAKAAQKFRAADAAVEGIPFGQPILVDHYSARRHRNAIERCDTNMRAGIERADMAKHHEQVADTLRDRLDTNIFSDDGNAIEALEMRIAEREAERDRIKAYNASCRKGNPDDSLLSEEQRKRYAAYYKSGPFPAYVLSSISGKIKADRDRIKSLRREELHRQRVDNAGGVLIVPYMTDRVQVSFAEKPVRNILAALRAAGFFWSGGRWNGALDKLPAEVREPAEPSIRKERSSD